MADFNPNAVYSEFNETERDAVIQHLEAGELSAARLEVIRISADKDIELADEHARLIVDLFRSDLIPSNPDLTISPERDPDDDNGTSLVDNLGDGDAIP